MRKRSRKRSYDGRGWSTGLVELTAKIVSTASATTRSWPAIFLAADRRYPRRAVARDRAHRRSRARGAETQGAGQASVMPDHIVRLEDGKKFKSLKRHLRTHYNLSPEEYREKWGLPHDYPMVGPELRAGAVGSGQEDGPRHPARETVGDGRPALPDRGCPRVPRARCPPARRTARRSAWSAACSAR